jgi:hypothetical protein
MFRGNIMLLEISIDVFSQMILPLFKRPKIENRPRDVHHSEILGFPNEFQDVQGFVTMSMLPQDVIEHHTDLHHGRNTTVFTTEPRTPRLETIWIFDDLCFVS